MLHPNDRFRTVKIAGQEYQWDVEDGRYVLRRLVKAEPVRPQIPEVLPWPTTASS